MSINMTPTSNSFLAAYTDAEKDFNRLFESDLHDLDFRELFDLENGFRSPNQEDVEQDVHFDRIEYLLLEDIRERECFLEQLVRGETTDDFGEPLPPVDRAEVCDDVILAEMREDLAVFRSARAGLVPDMSYVRRGR